MCVCVGVGVGGWVGGWGGWVSGGGWAGGWGGVWTVLQLATPDQSGRSLLLPQLPGQQPAQTSAEAVESRVKGLGFQM